MYIFIFNLRFSSMLDSQLLLSFYTPFYAVYKNLSYFLIILFLHFHMIKKTLKVSIANHL